MICTGPGRVGGCRLLLSAAPRTRDETKMTDSTYDFAFETIGNATVIVHDGSPLLATDPWLSGSAYFGSWILSHEIPEEQLASIRACPYLWISHGHPDHLHVESLATLADKTILLADHVGGRIRDSLTNDGYRVKVLPDRRWVPLSPRVRIMALADPYQDSVLLIDMDGVLIIDANDCNDRGWGPTARREARRSRRPILLALAGYGDADMINYFDERGERIPPKAARKIPPGIGIIAKLHNLGAQAFVPFATMHRYQRDDSIWANEYTTPIDAFSLGFTDTSRELLPAFIRYDVRTHTVTQIDPAENPIEPKSSREFGDDWDERLSPSDVEVIGNYFEGFDLLHDVVDTVTFRVGGVDHAFEVGENTGRSVRFDTPRRSLVDTAEWKIFDDLLIGNFMRTTLSGDWPTNSLRPDFSSRVAKYADNGLAHTEADVERYLAAYRRRSPRDHVEYELRRRYSLFVKRLARKSRTHVASGSALHRAGQRLYARARR